MKLVPVLLFVSGAVLIIAGLKNMHPVDVIMTSLGKEATRGRLDGSKPIVGFSQPIPRDEGPALGGGGARSHFLRLPIVET